ncbi:hypothetical protein NQT72_16090 [Pseudoalteromonas carrageenovora]|uniref:hypothetical protein n=1 Tax=Pseudoalteromonas carrageenovora TaxID=227 RepID=UPI0021190F38|nr:hypothetical protein [Pseudoalteromonas carrageenovora]MCQ8891015.1 hypothetical protein [Pseudoalteromonas carrageenovora]
MADILWSLVAIRDYVGIFITWLFVFAFLYNLSASINTSQKANVCLSLIMMISYSSSTLFDMVIVSHLNYFYFDIVTLAAIFSYKRISKEAMPVSFNYVAIGLSINASLFLAMHYDIEVRGTLYYWWFWNVYVFGMYFTDLIMQLALIVNRDIFGIKKLKNYSSAKFSRA